MDDTLDRPNGSTVTVSDDPLETTRGLLTTTASVRHGYLDVLGESTASPALTLARRAMNSPLVATVYERLWRPAVFYAASGITTSVEQRRAAATLRCRSAMKLHPASLTSSSRPSACFSLWLPANPDSTTRFGRPRGQSRSDVEIGRIARLPPYRRDASPIRSSAAVNFAMRRSNCWPTTAPRA